MFPARLLKRTSSTKVVASAGEESVSPAITLRAPLPLSVPLTVTSPPCPAKAPPAEMAPPWLSTWTLPDPKVASPFSVTVLPVPAVPPSPPVAKISVVPPSLTESWPSVIAPAAPPVPPA